MIFRVDSDEAFAHLRERFARLQDPDASPLMATWMQIIERDNRKGVLAGLDKNGNPMTAVTYRPVDEATTIKAQTRGQGKYIDPAAAWLYGNLPGSIYRTLDGPPLAPRGVFSRVITNLVTESSDAQRREGVWEAFGFWDDVVARDGEYTFLNVHFLGQPLGKFGPSIQRDLRGVRPEGVDDARAAAVNWMTDTIRSGGL